ncbi:YjbF family lipoprotein [Falsiroseomonas sp. CW058]|uniref:YjbF family lipoprotein n=1 Tax=Falsiroseomonas sp. CW058 TaxID=3388664 RepID=UPI003D321A7F
MAIRPRLIPAAAALLLAGCGMPWDRAPAPDAAPGPVAGGPALLLSAPRQAVLRPLPGAGPRRIWRAEEGIAIETEGARVTATAGLGPMLMSTRFEGPDPLEDPAALLRAPAAARRLVDLSGADRDPAGMRFGLTLDCTLRAREEAEAILVEERCTGGGTGFTNRFWISPAGGAVLRSEQWVGDGLAPLAFRLIGP